MAKLDYLPDLKGDKGRPPCWNERCRDVANITRWVGRQIEHDLNWQIVNLAAPVEDLHDAPVLYISGKDPLGFNADQQAKLKQFVEQGGLILGNADCGNRNFADSFRKLGQAMFPMYEFRELPAQHPIYTSQQFRRPNWPGQPFLQGLSNGAREMMLLFPSSDPARGWQQRAFGGAMREPLAQVMANIFLYAVNKQNLRYKGETYIVTANPAIKATATIRIARAQYPGTWDPEPGGWPRLAAILHNKFEVDLDIQSVNIGQGKLLTGKYAVAHLTGTSRYRLTAAAKDELTRFVQGGGTLIVDATGGAADFTSTMEPDLLAMFKATEFTTLKLDHPVYSSGEKITTIGYRSTAKKVLTSLRARD